VNKPPTDWLGFWIRFGCSFIFFGFIFALGFLRFVDHTGLLFGSLIWAMLTIGISIYAAKAGDEAWHKIINALRWWA